MKAACSFAAMQTGGSPTPGGQVPLIVLFAGGPAPLIATALLGATGGYNLIALYMAAMVLITIVTAFVSPAPYGDSLRRKEVAT